MYSDKFSQDDKVRKRRNDNDEDSYKRRSMSKERDYGRHRSSRSNHKEKRRSRSRSKDSRKSKERKHRRSKSRDKKHKSKRDKKFKSRQSSSKSPDKKSDGKDISPKMTEEQVDIIEELPPLDYNSDEFIEMAPKNKKKGKKAEFKFPDVIKSDVLKNGANAGDGDMEIDPLDAYMTVVSQDCNELFNKSTAVSTSNKKTAGTNDVELTRDYFEDKEDKYEDIEIKRDNDTLESLTQAYLEEKRQKLPEVDHDKIYYRKYNFSLYNEVPEVSKLSQREVKAIRKQREIIVKGKDCPKPISKWSHAIIKRSLLNALHYNKMDHPTAIQSQTIPAIMSGRDVIGVAKTGSGKTLAYLLPLLRHIANQDPVTIGQGPIALVLCPTRELTIQIYQEVEKFSQFIKKIRCGCLFGGADTAQQIAKLKKGVEIVVATPGRMIDIMTTNSGRNLNLARVTFIVLDEADRMFDLGFEPQVLAILARVRPQRQTVMFSATFPRKIEAIARKIQRDPLEIRAGGGNKVCNDVRQHVTLLNEEEKFLRLTDILAKYEDQGKILIFVEKQETATIVSSNLNHQNYRNQALHGGLNQQIREQAIYDFRNGNIWLLIATSVAARGLDVTDLVCVINFDCPNHYEDYIHRCGRTGRAGNQGDAFTFVSPDQEVMISWLVKALKESGQEIPADLKEAFEQYSKRMKQEGKEIKAPSGFRGHGFKFDAAEAMREKEKRLKERKKLCPEDMTEEDEAILQEMDGPGGTGYGNDSANGPGGSTGAASMAVIDEGPESAMRAQTHARTAQQIAARLTQQRIGGNDCDDDDISGINQNKPIYKPPQDPSANLVRKEMLINHYPAHIRYLLTTKELRTSLVENYEVSSLVKGEYVNPRDMKRLQRQPAQNSYHHQAAGSLVSGSGSINGVSSGSQPRPLHLVLEAENQMALNAAENEIIRVVKEGLNKK